MSKEADEAKLVNRTAAILRMARHVIEKLHEDKEKGFQEEPSLSDLVLVAQILGQTSMFDRLGEAGFPEGAETPDGTRQTMQAMVGPITLPDILVMWGPDGWYVNAHPDFQLQVQQCRNKEELLSVLQGVADICASNRIS